jgi:anthranilate phosphoribosyltransferase
MLYASGKAATFELGLEKAREVLASNAAFERLQMWREASGDMVRSA